VPHRLTPIARRLRRDATSAEKLLWRALRGKQLEGFRFRRQVPLAGYVADFACHEARLVVEIDGATHSTDAERTHDARRPSALEAAGYVVLRFCNFDVYEQIDSVVDAILLKLRSLRPRAVAGDFPTPHPNPRPQGEREHR
jgi:very-short-patch-repair endonuclease